MHLFPPETTLIIPERFTDPFRYSVNSMVKTAAELTIAHIGSSEELSSIFAEGKMLGILVVSDKNGNIGYLSGFSGNVGGRSTIDGFVPPIFDLTDPDGYFKSKEAEITAINTSIEQAEKKLSASGLKLQLSEAEQKRDEEIGGMRVEMAVSRKNREEIRTKTSDPSCLNKLICESQFEKAELKRLKARWQKTIGCITDAISHFEEEIQAMKISRAKMSEDLQKWIFSRYIVHNALGEEKEIGNIFADAGLTPPGGTGECAAPKLLEYAYRHSLKPLAMGEFWYGLSPSSAVRTQGHFYPSCTSKCGPLLSFMLKGLDLENDPYPVCGQPEIIFEDNHIIIISKPSGMPSVPGLDGRLSLYEWLSSKYRSEIFTVHRLDMDTSGIMVYARDRDSYTVLQQQFEKHIVSKTYKARLSKAEEGCILKAGDKGTIRLPLDCDYDERPRQKVDHQQGKEAMTEYEVIGIREDGMIDIIFRPCTGRTHQLRIHSAHSLGLGHPIAGDLLYGGESSSRMLLHAFKISLIHPVTKSHLTFSSDKNTY